MAFGTIARKVGSGVMRVMDHPLMDAYIVGSSAKRMGGYMRQNTQGQRVDPLNPALDTAMGMWSANRLWKLGKAWRAGRLAKAAGTALRVIR